jgi:hypothetical protein
MGEKRMNTRAENLRLAAHAIIQEQGGRWVSGRIYAAVRGLAEQTLINWRYQDRVLGLTGARPGFPIYRRWGRVVRYFLPNEDATTV